MFVSLLVCLSVSLSCACELGVLLVIVCASFVVSFTIACFCVGLLLVYVSVGLWPFLVAIVCSVFVWWLCLVVNLFVWFVHC